MDPNEYDLLQGSYLLVLEYPESVSIACYVDHWLCWFFFYKRHFLDVFHLGKEQAINLGIDTDRFQFLLLCCVSF